MPPTYLHVPNTASQVTSVAVVVSSEKTATLMSMPDRCIARSEMELEMMDDAISIVPAK
jgi:hypothetical protein